MMVMSNASTSFSLFRQYRIGGLAGSLDAKHIEV